MVIKKIEIKEFGKIKNYSVELCEGAQIICAPNEWGKSTVSEFIKIMFYSRLGGEKSGAKDRTFRQRYSPWSGGTMSGAIEFIHNDDTYMVQKEISKESSGKDLVLVQNMSSGETIKLGKKQEVGEYFFGIDVKSFERSSYIGTLGKQDFESSKPQKDGIFNKILGNLCETGESDVSGAAISKKIEDAMRELKLARGNGGKIFEYENKLNIVNKKINDFELLCTVQSEIKEQINKIFALKKELAQLEKLCERSKYSKKLNQIDSLISLVKEKEKITKNWKNSGIKYDDFAQNIKKIMIKSESIEALKKKLDDNRAVINSLMKDFTEINARENDFIKNKIKEKELLKLRHIEALREIDRGVERIYDCSLDCFDEKTRLKILKLISSYNELNEKYQNIQKNGIAADNLEKLNDKLDAQKKISVFGGMLLGIVFAAIAIVFTISAVTSLAYVCAGMTFLTFGAGCVFGKKLNNKINIIKLQRESALQIESDINEVRHGFENTARAYADNIKKEIFDIDEIISDFLKKKNCEDVQDYYEKYAQSEHLAKLKSVQSKSEIELECEKESFFVGVSAYCDCKDYTSAKSVAVQFESELRTVKSLEEKISYNAKIMGIYDFELQNLEILRSNIKERSEACGSNDGRNFSDAEIKRIDYLKSLNLEDKYINLIKSVQTPAEDLGTLKAQREHIRKNISDMKKYYESLSVIKEVLEDTRAELRKSFNPELDRKASEIFALLTNGKYDSVHVNKDYDIFITRDAQGHFCQNFSSGTIDQAYLALRVAVSEIMPVKTPVPMILDDAFMEYDDSRLSAAFEFLENYPLFKKSQVIMFTCHGYVAKCAEKCGIYIIK